MAALLRFAFLLGLKAFGAVFYRYRVHWVARPPKLPYERVRIVAFLNHTNLFEWLFGCLWPVSFLWKLASRGVLAGADVTLNRPLVGRFFRWLSANPAAITRRHDSTWSGFLDMIGPDGVVLIAPEGRMKRPDGLNYYGKPMTVKGGVADVLERVGEGDLLVIYSGGLHHIHVHGELLPKLFKTVPARLELLDIPSYLAERRAEGGRLRDAVARDLQARRDLHCPAAWRGERPA